MCIVVVLASCTLVVGACVDKKPVNTATALFERTVQSLDSHASVGRHIADTTTNDVTITFRRFFTLRNSVQAEFALVNATSDPILFTGWAVTSPLVQVVSLHRGAWKTDHVGVCGTDLETRELGPGSEAVFMVLVSVGYPSADTFRVELDIERALANRDSLKQTVRSEPVVVRRRTPLDSATTRLLEQYRRAHPELSDEQ